MRNKALHFFMMDDCNNRGSIITLLLFEIRPIIDPYHIMPTIMLLHLPLHFKIKSCQ